MPRKSQSPDAAPRSRQHFSAARPAPRAATDVARNAAALDFPFARSVEEDELRDMSGYGWGV